MYGVIRVVLRGVAIAPPEACTTKKWSKGKDIIVDGLSMSSKENVIAVSMSMFLYIAEAL